MNQYHNKIKKGIYFFILFIFLLFNIYYFTPKVFRKIQRKLENIKYGNIGDCHEKASFKDFNKYFIKVKEIVIRELLDLYISPNAEGKLRELQQIGFWYPTALLSGALESCHRTFGIDTDLDVLIKFYDKYIDERGNFINLDIIEYPGNIMHGSTLIYLEQVRKDREYQVAIDKLYSFLKTYPRSKTGIIAYRKHKPDLILVDSLGMICPFLSRYGRIYNKPEAIKLAEVQILDFIENGVDHITGLPFHGYIAGRKGYVGILGWGRGTGWYLLGLIGMLENISVESISRKKIILALRQLVTTLEIYQRKDGAWSCCITDPYSRKEMSATAMIAYSIERAINLDLLPKKYYKMLDKACNALIFETTDKGFLMNASGDCEGLGRYSKTYGHYLWVQGPATAFYSILLKRRTIEKP